MRLQNHNKRPDYKYLNKGAEKTDSAELQTENEVPNDVRSLHLDTP